MIIKPAFTILTTQTEMAEFPRRIEEASRLCFAGQAGLHPQGYVRARIRAGHESILEHCSVSVRFVMSRAAANQLVRHRHCAFTQESMRYVKQNERKVICPFDDPPEAWVRAVNSAFDAYADLMEGGAKAEDARTVLPLCTATTIQCTANLREWRHIFELRTGQHAQAEIRGLMKALEFELGFWLPCVFLVSS